MLWIYLGCLYKLKMIPTAKDLAQMLVPGTYAAHLMSSENFWFEFSSLPVVLVFIIEVWDKRSVLLLYQQNNVLVPCALNLRRKFECVSSSRLGLYSCLLIPLLSFWTNFFRNLVSWASRLITSLVTLTMESDLLLTTNESRYLTWILTSLAGMQVVKCILNKLSNENSYSWAKKEESKQKRPLLLITALFHAYS